jgi:DNA-binding NarL/FixJ family response regulator
MKRVLHIEHRPDVVDWVRTVLDSDKLEVTAQESGEAAIRQLSDADYDLVLLSLEVPSNPDARVIKWIAANRPHLLSRVLVVADTALRPGVSAVLEALEIPLLFAPFTSGELALLVKVMLAGRPADVSHRGSAGWGHAMAS